jgi:hypothetical protein
VLRGSAWLLAVTFLAALAVMCAVGSGVDLVQGRISRESEIPPLAQLLLLAALLLLVVAAAALAMRRRWWVGLGLAPFAAYAGFLTGAAAALALPAALALLLVSTAALAWTWRLRPRAAGA